MNIHAYFWTCASASLVNHFPLAALCMKVGKAERLCLQATGCLFSPMSSSYTLHHYLRHNPFSFNSFLVIPPMPTELRKFSEPCPLWKLWVASWKARQTLELPIYFHCSSAVKASVLWFLKAFLNIFWKFPL